MAEEQRLTKDNEDAMRGIKFDLPFPDKELNPNKLLRVHWTKRAKLYKIAKDEAYWLTPNTLGELADDELLIVFYNFISPDLRWRDQDNVFCSFKPYSDGIAQRLKIDDRHFKLGQELHPPHSELFPDGVTHVNIRVIPAKKG